MVDNKTTTSRAQAEGLRYQADHQLRRAPTGTHLLCLHQEAQQPHRVFATTTQETRFRAQAQGLLSSPSRQLFCILYASTAVVSDKTPVQALGYATQDAR
ncbi:hypothetical protein TcWFU_004257 [Taenia crassiceps]|uniref:Uncharacterized protein n=1 Tax=Taenia crassiceps TaxID=6207 RepID=A0ABR4QKC0_9CEST